MARTRPLPPAAGSPVSGAESTALISFVVPVYRPEPAFLTEAIDSVLAQSDPGWQLVLVADGPQPRAVDRILDGLDDRRCVVLRRDEQGGIVAASNDGIAAATAPFVGFLDNDDTLAPDAVAACRDCLELDDEIDVLYSDEDKLDLAGRRVEPFHKPAWSPARLRGQMYLGHLCVYRRALVEEVGRLRQAFHGAQDHDLALRTTERARKVAHIPRILYHWRQSETSVALDPAAKDWAFEAGVRAVQDHLERTGIPGVARRDGALVGVTEVVPDLPEQPLVSIVILTGGTERTVKGERFVLAERAVQSIVHRSSYANYEIIVVLDANSTDELEDRLTHLGAGRVRVVRDHLPFSYARANNLGVTHASGDLLVLLNDDTDVTTADWLERLVLWLGLPEVGAVGCVLEYADGRIQHAGVASRSGGPFHRYAGFSAGHRGYLESLGVTVNTLAATGACLAMSRENFEAVGGFATEFPLNFNDVDLCLKLVAAGLHVMIDPRVRIIHYETSTRPKLVEAWEVEAMWARWGWHLENDPWDNPNLVGDGIAEIPASPALTRVREAAGWHPAPRIRPGGGASISLGAR